MNPLLARTVVSGIYYAAGGNDLAVGLLLSAGTYYVASVLDSAPRLGEPGHHAARVHWADELGEGLRQRVVVGGAARESGHFLRMKAHV